MAGDGNAREMYGFSLGGAGDATTAKQIAVPLKPNSVIDLLKLFEMKKLAEADVEKYDSMTLSQAIRDLVVIPLRVTFIKGKGRNGNVKTGSGMVYVPRDRIEEAIDKDNGIVKKKFNGFKITEVYVPRKRTITY